MRLRVVQRRRVGGADIRGEELTRLGVDHGRGSGKVRVVVNGVGAGAGGEHVEARVEHLHQERSVDRASSQMLRRIGVVAVCMRMYVYVHVHVGVGGVLAG